jgi:hypothetical protein
VKHLQQKGRAYICNFQRQPMFTHCNQFLSDATCPGRRIDTSTTPVFGYAEKGRVRPSIERASKRSRPAVQGQPGRPGAAMGPPGQFCRQATAPRLPRSSQVSHWLPPRFQIAILRSAAAAAASLVGSIARVLLLLLLVQWAASPECCCCCC